MRFPVTSIALGWDGEKSQEERKSNKTRTIHEAQTPLDVIETTCFGALMWTKQLEEQETPALDTLGIFQRIISITASE